MLIYQGKMHGGSVADTDAARAVAAANLAEYDQLIAAGCSERLPRAAHLIYGKVLNS